MYLIDSHCHLDHFPQEELDGLLNRALETNVQLMVSISTSQANFEKVLAIAERYPFVYASVGIHPSEVGKGEEKVYDWLVACAAHPKVVGLGETGLDGLPSCPPLSAQEASFRAHMEAALTTGLPLIVHMRAQEERFLALMKAYEKRRPKGVLHCFTGSLLCGQTAQAWGWKISLSGIVTFKNALALQSTVHALGPEGLLIETDSPWLAPQAHRGQRNEPSYLVHTATYLAQLLGRPLEELAQGWANNFFELFSKVPRMG